MVRDGALGELRLIELFMGEKFDWPVTTGFYFGVGGAPHGVLLDKGPHALDVFCWWLGGKPEVVSHTDDSFGGGEAMVDLQLRHAGCTVNAYFSFLNRYPNTYEIRGDAGRILGSIRTVDECEFVGTNGKRKTIKAPLPAAAADGLNALLIDNFLAVVRGSAQPLIGAADVLDSVVLLDECYQKRRRFDMPWHDTWSRVAHV
jgi:predicted dehydrogenase